MLNNTYNIVSKTWMGIHEHKSRNLLAIPEANLTPFNSKSPSEYPLLVTLINIATAMSSSTIPNPPKSQFPTLLSTFVFPGVHKATADKTLIDEHGTRSRDDTSFPTLKN
ncbi:hypothetical protein GWI33_005720 [Rhynchophorus ferrugineus]|uniref:Uncharacterized protein n=1 Tax=Rhynchophorus ferrugineus TaxID=354439 RepID=A0A834IMH5_RHYFE|nr:hypothetical protein GWI33_005720 [Rhynchophorus ferrugineus]